MPGFARCPDGGGGTVVGDHSGRFSAGKSGGSAQEVAQYCATSCALGCRACPAWAAGQFTPEILRPTAQLLAQLVFAGTAVLPSRAGSLPQGNYGLPEFGLSRKTCGSEPTREGVGSGKTSALTHRFREQAHSYKGFVVCPHSGAHPGICGSELAREGVCSGKAWVTDTPLSRAGSLLQRICALPAIWSPPRNMWERACSRRRLFRQNIGTDTPLSRASSLLQGICGLPAIWSPPRNMWERACSRRRLFRQSMGD